ncbi:DLA class II histocompatibility antigen, DR-1 beta chain [Myotis davidii]|uniref:DLA class II histocompatibility antigen, DR-1 beta chain n=1 Tax=Myotis davidii TaxID=225400 RepID=L5LJC5_MYODS|nr:DLA class II histocompatibility antigen, DR-1 beta chain [Myotis davidii]
MMVLTVPSAHFLEQLKSECHFSNGTERVRYLQRYIHNGQEDVRFDSDVGEYHAVTELGRPDAEAWNSQKDSLEQKRAEVDTFCREAYRVLDGFLVHRQTEPTVTVYPSKTQRLQHHNLLVCSVNGFYPGHIESKVLSGASGFVLGLLFLGAGLLIYFRAQKGHSGLQPTGNTL